MGDIQIIDTDEENILEYGVCGYKNIKRPGYAEKIEWLKERFKEGLKIKTLYSEKGGTQGMIEFIPGEYCWRPVDAKGYMFIHCIFAGFKGEYRGKGYGTFLLNECLKDAQQQNMDGVAVVTRKSSFMAGNEIFTKNGFSIVDKAPPDFELLVKKFRNEAKSPSFRINWGGKELNRYGQGLTIIRADQCPYTVKNVREIIETAKTEYNIEPNVIDLMDCKEAQNCPCAFGAFCIVYDGQVISHHPISNTRFKNIMKKVLR